jgi:hypothetical protein
VPLAFHSRREADHSPPSSAEVKEWVELYLHSPIRLHGVVLRGSTGTSVTTVICRRNGYRRAITFAELERTEETAVSWHCPGRD